MIYATSLKASGRKRRPDSAHTNLVRSVCSKSVIQGWAGFICPRENPFDHAGNYKYSQWLLAIRITATTISTRGNSEPAQAFSVTGFFLVSEGQNVHCIFGLLMAVQRYIAGVSEGNHQFAQFRHFRQWATNARGRFQTQKLL